MNTLLQYLFPIKHRTLIRQLVRREVLGRYRGSMLGIGWSVLTPLAMLSVYTLVFRHIFKSRWPGMEDGNLAFALNLFAGLIVFTWAAEFINRAPRLVVEQPNLVTKVVFPLHILPWTAMLSSLFHACLATAVWLAACLATGYSVSVTWLALPLAFLALLPFMLGLGWLLAALGVYFRDIGEITGPVMSMMLFLTPVFFPISVLPAFLQGWLQLNPLTVPIESLRAIILLGQWPDWLDLLWLVVGGTGLLLVGQWVFERARRGFADVL